MGHPPTKSTENQQPPVVACYLSEFLKKDMNHVYRQVVGLENFRPVVITRKRENPDRFPFDESQVHTIPKSRLRLLRRFYYHQLRHAPIPLGKTETQALAQAVSGSGAQLLHVYFGHIALRLLPYLRQSPIPIIVSFHGADATSQTHHQAYQKALQETFRLSHLVLARSQALLDTLAELGCPQEKLRLQRTGIPLEKWPFEARQPPPDGTWKFAQICRFIPKKGLATTLHTFAEIHRQYPSAHLTLAGDGPLTAQVTDLIKKLGITGAVTLPGFLDEAGIRRLLGETHFFFHPSQTDETGSQEGVPNAMLEAMATGLPALATHHGGIPEAVEDSVSGILVREGDHQELAQRVVHLLQQPTLYHPMSRAAREAVESRFSRQHQIATLEATYSEALLA